MTILSNRTNGGIEGEEVKDNAYDFRFGASDVQ